jgi:hypothetical protein
MPRSYTGKKIEVGLDAYDPKIPPKLRSKENFVQFADARFLCTKACTITVPMNPNLLFLLSFSFNPKGLNVCITQCYHGSALVKIDRS